MPIPCLEISWIWLHISNISSGHFNYCDTSLEGLWKVPWWEIIDLNHLFWYEVWGVQKYRANLLLKAVDQGVYSSSKIPWHRATFHHFWLKTALCSIVAVHTKSFHRKLSHVMPVFLKFFNLFTSYFLICTLIVPFAALRFHFFLLSHDNEQILLLMDEPTSEPFLGQRCNSGAMSQNH